jgi:hypothetical protein
VARLSTAVTNAPLQVLVDDYLVQDPGAAP